jgi:signal transduction histidine kinase
VVSDVDTCDFLAGSPALEDLRRTGIRAVQSTPLVGRSGRLLGMISTHWRQPHEPPERDLRLLDLLARQAADLIERTHAEASLRESEVQLRRTSQLLEEAVRAREEFLSTAAHELRNPVNALQLQLMALLRATQDGTEPVPREWARDRIGQAVTAVRRLVRLVETLLDCLEDHRRTRGPRARADGFQPVGFGRW